MRRIPVKLVRVEGSTEVSMDMDDFESSGVSVADDVRALKGSYNALLRDVKPVLAGKPSTTARWRACRRLAEFVDTYDRFDITNFAAACDRDMGSKSNFRLLVRFGREFSESEIHDSIPYSSYRTLILKRKWLEQHGAYESEKAKLLGTGAGSGRQGYGQ